MVEDIRTYVAEMIGTLVLVTGGGMAIVSSGTTGSGLLAVALGFGFAFIVAFYLIGHISGAHLNPAVTLAMALEARMEWVRAAGYWISQAIGAVFAMLLVLWASGPVEVDTTVTRSLDIQDGLIVEILLTAVFVLTVLTVTRRAPQMAGMVIGLALIMVHLAAVPISGASVNPARSFGSAIVGGEFGDLWIYIVGPVVGALIAWAVSSFTNMDRESLDDMDRDDLMDSKEIMDSIEFDLEPSDQSAQGLGGTENT